MPTFDFESSISSDFINDSDNPWTRTSAKANGGTWSIKAESGNGDNFSMIMLVADFDAGDVTFYHQVSSESGFDVGGFRVDNTDTPNWTGSGTEIWTQATVAISAGKQALIWYYAKDFDTDSNDDTLYIDDIVVPNYTLVDLSDAEIFTSGIPAGWTEDATAAEKWVSNARTVMSGGGSVRSASGQDGQDSDLLFDSDSGAPAGQVYLLYAISAEQGFDFGKFQYDSVDQFSQDGESKPVTPRMFVDAVSSGTREYKLRLSKDGSGADGFDRMDAYLLFEPGMSAAEDLSHVAALADSFDNVVQRRPIKVTNF